MSACLAPSSLGKEAKSGANCDPQSVGRELIEQRKREIDRKESKSAKEMTDPTNDRGFPVFPTKDLDRSNDKGITPRVSTPSAAEVTMLGRSFLEMKKAVTDAVLAMDPNLAKSEDPVRDFLKKSSAVSKIELLFSSETAAFDRIAEAAREGLKTSPDNQELQRFVSAHKSFATVQKQINSKYFVLAL